MRIDGKKIADGIISRLKNEPVPRRALSVVLVGDDKYSISFIKQKEKAAERLGVKFNLHRFNANVGNDRIREEVAGISAEAGVGGVIVQLPLPEEFNVGYILGAIPPEKDVDVLTENAISAGLVKPPPVGVVEEILREAGMQIEGKKVAVVGFGRLIGKPIVEALRDTCKEITVLRSKNNLADLKEADIVISGAGKAHIIKADMLKKTAGVIDFGYERLPDGRIAGDFEPPADENAVLFHTPTPGGTGPVLVAKLFENFYTLCKKDTRA